MAVASRHSYGQKNGGRGKFSCFRSLWIVLCKAVMFSRQLAAAPAASCRLEITSLQRCCPSNRRVTRQPHGLTEKATAPHRAAETSISGAVHRKLMFQTQQRPRRCCSIPPKNIFWKNIPAFHPEMRGGGKLSQQIRGVGEGFHRFSTSSCSSFGALTRTTRCCTIIGSSFF